MDIVKVVTVLSIVIESLTKTILLVWNIVSKPLTQWTQEEKKDIITVVISVIIAIGVNLDIFSISNIPFKIPILGPLLTGLLFARGAGVITDILDIIYYTKVNRKLKTLI
ncbi:MAG: hypothetical protein PWR06_2164 [Thermoanaerobacteraceae bacterium]|jgi:hypothetical protein|uniref:Uncharacterized protein n=1 Tax=Biomaibacter acetigenes TaxID=2316383 RepID=A0A3G2R4L2_9FIRM|nr:hypothetical protein [Biomaibacter acetigenes]AYO30058.1 hypothetical protein D2962_05030 [Biomaibacter acetigenes]MDK2879448.1 hypothetical protein [Thermoanaerobacteraceae bacterium]RKL63414.1 hypothetical protein DXT63_06495 [Thermoanaerobacteraceae bacterium SP2]